MNLTRHLVVLVTLSICTVFIGGLYSMTPVTEQRLPQGIQFGTSQESYFIASKGESNTREERKKFIASVRAALRIDPISADIVEKDEIPVREELKESVTEPIVVSEEATNIPEITPVFVTPEIIPSSLESTSTVATTTPAPTVISQRATQTIP